MGLQSYEYGLRPQDGFEVIKRISNNDRTLRNTKSPVYAFNWAPVYWTLSFYESVY